MRKWEQKSTRTALRCVHITATSAWIGGGLCVLLLLHHGRQAGSSGELFALTSAITAIDDFLIKLSAGGTFASGLLLCIVSNWGFYRHRWIVVKGVLTLGAIGFGITCLAPWLGELSRITAADGLAVFDDLRYFRFYHRGATASIAQTMLLLLLVLISISKPSFVRRTYPPRAAPKGRAEGRRKNEMYRSVTGRSCWGE